MSTRLFDVFDKDGNEYLDLVEFIDGMRILFSESFDNVSKMIFSLYDFDKDGSISKEDIRTVLSYVPLNIKKSKNLLKYERYYFITLVIVLKIESNHRRSYTKC